MYKSFGVCCDIHTRRPCVRRSRLKSGCFWIWTPYSLFLAKSLPVTGKHTNHVESYWIRMKSTFKRINGTYKDFGPSYMDEFMWRERYGKTQKLAYINLLKHMAEMYPC